MYSHVSIGVSDFSKSLKLYDGLMKSLGHKRSFGEEGEEFMAYGTDDAFLVINSPLDTARGKACLGNGSHVCFSASSRKVVDDFHETALSLGATSDGAPGIREEYSKDYYAAFILDFDGNKIEVLTYSKK